MRSQKQQLPDRLSRGFKLRFSTGDLSTSIPLALIMFFQLYFLTDVARLRPDYAAWAIAVGRIWDAFNDPLFGLFSDRIHSRWGRRRVLLLFGAVPLGLAFMLMWQVPPFGQVGLAVYYAVTFILFDTAFTAVHVGYNSLTPEMTFDYDERSSLNGYRMVFNIAGTLGAIILATVLGWFMTDHQLRFTVLGVILGFVSIVPPLIVFRTAYERPQPIRERAISPAEALSATVRNRPFQLVMGLYLLSWTTASILSAVLIYYASYYFRVPEQANYFVLVAQSAAIAFIPVCVWISKQLDKRRAFILGMSWWAVILLAIVALRPDQVVWAYLLAGLSGLGIATAYVVPWSMLPDIIEHDAVRTGERREGSFYALASFFQKLGTGAALWAMGQALAAVGYVAPSSEVAVPAQPAEALQALRIFVGPIPVVLLILSIVFAWFYPITRQAHHQLVEELGERAL